MTSGPSLLEFLQTGTLSPLAIGMSRQDVESSLGKPDDVSTSRKPLIWKYGPLQLTFDNARQYALAGIELYTSDLDEPLPAALCDLAADPIWSKDTSVQTIGSHLEPLGIELSPIEHSTYDDRIGLRTGAGVGIYFRSRGALLDKILFYTQRSSGQN